MKKTEFKLGKTEAGILQAVNKNSDEEAVIGIVLSERFASGTDVVKNSIKRLLEKNLIERKGKGLILTDCGKCIHDLL